MKNSLLAGLAAGFLFVAVFSSAAWADDWYNGCEKKEQILETKIEYAKKHGNHNQLRGLEKALREVRSNCSDGSRNYRDAYKDKYKADSKVQDKRAKVEERQRELDEAIRERAKPDKIKKRQRKLEEAKAELAEAIR